VIDRALLNVAGVSGAALVYALSFARWVVNR
jgi:hypothetical protein